MTHEEFKKFVMECADMMGVEPKEIHIRPMTKKWASCSSSGRLSFNKEVLDQTFEHRAEAVIHELLHLRYPNHGKMFQRMLKKYISDLEVKDG